MSIVKAMLARDRIGTGTVIQYALTSATALLVIVGLITTGWQVTGIVPAPLVLLLIGMVVFVFIPGYSAIATRLKHAGALYACITAGLGRPAGVAAGLVSTYTYSLLQIGVFGVIGAEFVTVTAGFGVTISWWAGAGAAWLICAICGVLRVDISGRVLAVLLGAEIALMVIFDVLAFAHPHGGQVSLAALSPSSLLVPGVGAWVAIAATAFAGFEQPAVLSEEVREPGKTVGRAMWLSAGLMAVLYVLSSLAVTVAVGPGNVVQAARQHGPELLFVTLGQWAGPNATVVMLGAHLMFLTSLQAGAISYHTSVSRYGYALGREGVLPRWLGRTGSRTGAPVAASLAHSTVAALTITCFAVMGWDPLTRLFFWLGTMGGFGLLLLLCTTAVAIAAFTVTRAEDGPGIWRGIVLPVASIVLMGGGLVLTVRTLPTLLGVDAGSLWVKAWPASFGVLAMIGLLWALIMRRRDPHGYRQIGAGVAASTVPTPPSVPGRATPRVIA